MSTTARIKRAVAMYGGTLGAVAVVVALVAFSAAGYLYLNPPTEEIPPEETNVQQFSLSVDHSAIVTNTTSLYPRQTRLQNQPVYFTNATPRLRISLLAQTPPDHPVTVTQELVVHHRGEFNGRVFWRNETTLIENRQTIEDGSARINASVNVPKLQQRRTNVTREVGSIGTITSEIRTRLSYSSPTDDGGNYTGELTASTPLQFSGAAYWLGNNLSASQTERQLGQGVVRQLSPNYTLIGGLAVGGIVLFIAGLGVVVWSSRHAESYELEIDVYRDRYDEWISEGEFPTDATNKYVYINSILDLVDVAIDTNKRVIYDPDLETFSVVDGDVVYYHAEDPTTLSSWLGFSTNE